MDGEDERYMDVLERPSELQPTYRSAFLHTIPERLPFGCKEDQSPQKCEELNETDLLSNKT